MLKSKRTYLIPIVGFALIILIATELLCLPICNYKRISFKDALFITTSALTTTGFTKAPVISQFNFLGQVILAVLMEIGAMGFIIFISYIWSIKDKKIKMSDIIVISDNISNDNYGLMKQRSIFIGKFMLKVQLIGTLCLAVKFVPSLGIMKGVWYSIFHTISAFSNTGLDLFGGNSLIVFQSDVYIQIVFLCLMVIGSIGVLVIEDLKNNKTRKFERLRVQTKIVLVFSIVLLVIPTIFMKLLEPNISILNSLFMSASTRSTGFSVVDIQNLSFESKVILIILMFIGGAPASTAGGVKMITIAIIFATMISTLKGKNETIIFWRKIPDITIKKAFTIFMIFIILLVITCSIFLYYNPMSVLDITFNSVSAVTNTGLSIIDFNNLNLIGETIFIILMFVGRVGPLTMVLAFIREDKNRYIEYPIENVIL